MRVYVTEEERWPVVEAREPEAAYVGKEWYDRNVYDLPDEVVETLREAEAAAERARQAVLDAVLAIDPKADFLGGAR